MEDIVRIGNVELTEEEAQKMAADAVRAMRYRDDASGYIWIDRITGIEIIRYVGRAILSGTEIHLYIFRRLADSLLPCPASVLWNQGDSGFRDCTT